VKPHKEDIKHTFLNSKLLQERKITEKDFEDDEV